MDLVAYEEVEEAGHPVLDIIRQRIALWAGVIRLPQGGATRGACAPPARQVAEGEGHAVGIENRGVTVRAAGHPEGLAGCLVEDEPAACGGPALDDGGLPAVGQLCAFSAHHRE